MRLPAHANLADAEPIARLVQIDECGDRPPSRWTQSRMLGAAPCRRASSASRRVRAPPAPRRTRSAHRRRRSALRSSARLPVSVVTKLDEHALALDRHERGRLPERHAHLEARRLARPRIPSSPAARPCDRPACRRTTSRPCRPPRRRGRASDVALRRRRASRAHDHFAADARRDLADQQSLRVRAPLHFAGSLRVSRVVSYA